MPCIGDKVRVGSMHQQLANNMLACAVRQGNTQRCLTLVILGVDIHSILEQDINRV